MNPKRVALLLPLGLAMGVAFIWLSKNPPGTTSFLPGCPFHRLTGLHCPGCGMTRATYLLSHGQLWQAYRMNPFAITVLPFLIYGAAASLLTWLTDGRHHLPVPRLPVWSYWLLFTLIVTYGILRNIPTPPFKSLAPVSLSD